MSTQWTPAQAAAIADRGGSLLVSAAAGSGKTAVLVERAVGLICDPANPVEADRLLIVTFTNAAAAELRARIGVRLMEQQRADPADLRLQRQRMLLQRANICTIDAFCLKLLQQNFQALDIPPDFATADAGVTGQLRSEALAEVLEAACGNEAFRRFADLYGKGRSDAAAGQTVLQVYDFLRSLPDYPQKLQELLAPWRQPEGFAESLWCKALLEGCARQAQNAARLFALARALLEEDRRAALAKAADEVLQKKTARTTEAALQSKLAKAAEKVQETYTVYAERLDEALAAAETAQQLAAAGQWQRLYDALLPYREGEQPMPGIKGCRKKLTGDNKDAIRAQADAGADCFADLLKYLPCTLAEAEADRAEALPLLEALTAAVAQFDECYYRRKLERKVLEFSDFEHLALRLLRRADGTRTPLCERISSGFDAVMVDEYQDTNAIQDALYRCLARPAGDNLFFVGDLKQSIYRFRQAEPDIFKAKLEAFPPLPGGQPRPAEGEKVAAALALDANFRSAPAVVQGINFFFENLMTPRLGDVAYGDGQRLVCGAPGAYPGSVEAHVLATEEKAGDAAFVAQRIRRLVEEKAPVRCKEGTRPIRYEDCCILLSTRGSFAAYATALAAQGIPCYADSAEDLLCAPHIRPLVSLLRVIDNPAQDIELAAAMLSPLFGFTEDDLVRLRAACMGQRISLYGQVMQAAAKGQPAGAEELYTKINGFYYRLAALRAFSRTEPVERLLEEIFVSTGYLAMLGTMEDGPRRREDARRFAQLCAGMGGSGLPALIRAIDATEEAGGWKNSAPGRARPGCVTIMTIHRSKGLQFPAVFVADTAHKFNSEDSRRKLLLHRRYGMGLQLRAGRNGTYPTAAYEAIRMVQDAELRSEQLRLLYVALTRAQDRLVVTLPLKKPAETAAHAAVRLAADAGELLHGDANCFADWLLSALLRHPMGRELRAAAAVPLKWVETESELTITMQAMAPESLAEKSAPEQRVALLPQADPVLVQRLAEGFGWQYPDAGLEGIPAKVSVTSVVHARAKVSLDRPAFLSADGMTGAEKGTAMHAFLEHTDFAALAAYCGSPRPQVQAAVEAERDRQLALKLLAPEIAAQLDLGKLVQFFTSDVFGRMCEARQVLREYDFITALPAAAVLAAQNSAAAEGDVVQAVAGVLQNTAVPGTTVLVQGIADLILVFEDHLELLDYKTDRHKTAEQFRQEYGAQLNLYTLALDQRFAPKKVTRKGIYSLELGQWIEIA